jgi:hypothetical protein
VTDREIVYTGRIAERADGENDDALWVGDDPYDPFARRFQEDLERYGRRVTVRYYVTDEPRTAEQLLDNQIRVLAGDAKADYTQHYSEVTGYLWTDQELNVGGHNLLAELSGVVGMFLHMTVTFHGSEPK